MPHILVIDNYDSFVYTLNGYLQQFGAETQVVRNDALTASDLEAEVANLDGLLLSPGPGTPDDAGICIDAVGIALRHRLPLLGVCLGHQSIGEALGATVTNAPELMHGKTSLIDHDDSLLFRGVPHPFTGTRYHSLAIVDTTVPESLRVTAKTVESGVIMGVEHVDAPMYGVQFHPESVLTQGGYQMIGNWLEVCGLEGAAAAAGGMSPLFSSKPPVAA